jgi:hypothetical protein
VQVESGVAIVGVSGKREVRIEPNDLDPGRRATVNGGKVSGRLAHMTSVGSDA